MKKLIPLLLLLASILTLSGCVVVFDTSKYTMFFENDTETQIDDWYLKDVAKHKYTGSIYYYGVEPGETSSIDNLPQNFYRVYFGISSGGNDYYVHTENYVYLDSDTTFKLHNQSFHTTFIRSASSAESTDIENEKLVLIDSAGNEYALVIENE